jgi:hypothetical protein
MPKPIKIRVEGLATVKRALRQYQKQIEKDVYEVYEQSANEMAADARAYCEVPIVAEGIHVTRANGWYAVETEGDVSAWIEFGTGNYAKALLASYPEEWRDMAMRFYINGLGRTPSMPYLYPAYQKNASEAVDKIIDKIEGH